MQLQTPISSLSEFKYIDRFDDILKIALSTKCQIFYVDALQNKIFGFYEEGYSIIETIVPFKITTSFLFGGVKLNTIAIKDSIAMNKTYFIVNEYPYCLFPENRRADLMNNIIYYDYTRQGFVDRMTGKFLEDCLVTIDHENWFKMYRYTEILRLYHDRMCSLSYPRVFENIHENEVIQKVISSKVSQGAELLTLRNGEEVYSFYVFKSLLGPLTKSDKLTAYIQPDILEPNKFAITFSVYKKKSKLGIPDLIDQKVDTHVFMINLS